MTSRLLALAVLVLTPACGDNTALVDAGTDSMPDPMPATLADTGLCADAACSQFNPDVFAYAPRS